MKIEDLNALAKIEETIIAQGYELRYVSSKKKRNYFGAPLFTIKFTRSFDDRERDYTSPVKCLPSSDTSQ